MSASRGPLSADDIRRLLPELIAALVERGISQKLTVVGGAALTLTHRPDRGGTRDIDVIDNLRPGTEEVIHELARQHGLPRDWVNSAAQQFVPPVELETVTLFESGSVRVAVLSDPMMLAMKLLAGRVSKDEADIHALLAACGVESSDAAVEIFDAFFHGEQELKPTSRRILEEYFRD